MRHASDYKTEFGLYKATVKAINVGGFPRVRFCEQAMAHAKDKFPELVPQLEELIFGREAKSEDLVKTY